MEQGDAAQKGGRFMGPEVQGAIGGHLLAHFQSLERVRSRPKRKLWLPSCPSLSALSQFSWASFSSWGSLLDASSSESPRSLC